MNEHPIVSVIIPVFNRADSLSKCLGSVLEAVPHDSEIIIVDDGSTDSSLAVANRFAEHDERFVVRTQENSGWAGKPRNVGLSLARGKYVMFVDSDDALTETGLRNAIAFAEYHESDITLCRVSSHVRRIWEDVWEITEARPKLKKLVRTNHVMKLWRNSFLERTGLQFDENPRRLEDAIFCFRAYSATDKISLFADEVVYEIDRFSVGIEEQKTSAGAHISRQSIDWAAYRYSVKDSIDPLITAPFEEADIKAAVTDFFSRVVLSRFNRRWTDSPVKRRYELAELGFDLADRYADYLAVDQLVPQRRRILRSLWRADYLNVWRFARSRSRSSALSVRAGEGKGNRLVLDVLRIDEKGSSRPLDIDLALVAVKDKNALPVVLAEGIELNADGTTVITVPARKLRSGVSYYLRVTSGESTGDAYVMPAEATNVVGARKPISLLPSVHFGTVDYKRLTIIRSGFAQSLRAAAKRRN